MIKFKNNMTKKDGITFLVALCVSAILFLLDLFTKNIIIKTIMSFQRFYESNISI